jgi:hypothetical protein
MQILPNFANIPSLVLFDFIGIFLQEISGSTDGRNSGHFVGWADIFIKISFVVSLVVSLMDDRCGAVHPLTCAFFLSATSTRPRQCKGSFGNTETVLHSFGELLSWLDD